MNRSDAVWATLYSLFLPLESKILKTQHDAQFSLSYFDRSGIFVYCCDYSKTAIEIVKVVLIVMSGAKGGLGVWALQAHPSYDPSRCLAFEWDVTEAGADIPVPDGSINLLSAIFVLSAIPPEKSPPSPPLPGGLLRWRCW